MSKVTKSIVEAMRSANESKTKAYDTQATVTRIEGNTAWVHIPGGVDETPVRLTINAKEGDAVQVRVSGGSAWLVGNASSPPTDDTTAEKAYYIASTAEEESKIAHDAAVSAVASAEEAYSAAASAKTSADEAKAQAENAGEYAARALGNLSTVQSVAETLTYITQHGTMTLTTDVTLDPTHVYFVQDAGGDYTVGGVTYAIVTEPDVADIATYYELTIDESLQNYVGTHLALTSEGLWLLPATSGTNKVLIATGAGAQYTIAGTYLIDASGNTVASFRADGATMSAQGVQIAHLGYGQSYDDQGQLSAAPFFTFGTRADNNVGQFSVAEGENNTAKGYNSHAEGEHTSALTEYCHAEGYDTVAGTNPNAITARAAHAEGYGTEAVAFASHAQNYATKAASYYQTAVGRLNIVDSADKYVVIIGNGNTATETRSNALTVDWQGNVMAQGFAGKVEMFAGAVTQTVTSGVATTTGAPAGWLLCDGSILNVSEYPELAAVLGSLYGGDGTTTFALPDMRGRFPLGVGGAHALASTGGAETVKLTAAQSGVPAHGHGAGTLSVGPSGHKLRLASVALGSGGTSRNIPNSGSGTSSATFTDSHSISGSVANNTAADAASAHNNMPPFISMNFIIATGKTS